MTLNVPLKENTKLVKTGRKRTERRYSQRKIIRDKNRKRAIFERGSNCAYCGAHYPSDSFFDFHHRVPSKKRYSMGVYWNRGWAKIKVELAKCVMLCPSCHRIEHIKRGDLL